MWFDNAHGKEKITYIFNNELSLSEIELDKLIFHDISRLTLGFNIKNLPSLIPEKWEKNKLNTLALTLTFTEVSTIKLDGKKIGFECTPIIDAIENKTTLKEACKQNNMYSAFIRDVKYKSKHINRLENKHYDDFLNIMDNKITLMCKY